MFFYIFFYFLCLFHFFSTLKCKNYSQYLPCICIYLPTFGLSFLWEMRVKKTTIPWMPQPGTAWLEAGCAIVVGCAQALEAAGDTPWVSWQIRIGCSFGAKFFKTAATWQPFSTWQPTVGNFGKKRFPLFSTEKPFLFWLVQKKDQKKSVWYW